MGFINRIGIILTLRKSFEKYCPSAPFVAETRLKPAYNAIIESELSSGRCISGWTLIGRIFIFEKNIPDLRFLGLSNAIYMKLP